MNISIPGNIIRQFIFDILIERSNYEMDASDEIAAKELAQLECTTEYSAEIGWESCSTRVFADDVKEGLVSIEYALDMLSKQEYELLKQRCLQWFKGKEKEKHIR